MTGGSSPHQSPASGDALPDGCQTIEVRVAELRQIFNAIDPSPFHERDLDPRAEEFILGWGKDLPGDASLALVVYLDRAPGLPDEASALGGAVREFFGQRATGSRRRLRELFARGRVSLAIGLGFLAVSVGVGDAVAGYFAGSRLADVMRESLLIGGWVAMWRPLETFLYDWWPITSETRLLDRLARMPVRIVYNTESSSASDAWRTDWPALLRARLHAEQRAATMARHEGGASN